MRVLYLNHNVVGSGTFLRAFHLGRQLAQRGHRVTLVTTSRAARWGVRASEIDGLEVVESPDLWWGRARTGWDPYNTAVRLSFLRRRHFDIVHAFDSRPAVIYPALAAARRSKAPLFMDWADWWGRGGWINERSGWTVRTFFGPIETWFEEAYRGRAHGLTTISTALRERSIKLGIAPEKVARIGQGCEPELVRPMERSVARTELGLGSEPCIVHVGVLTAGDLQFLLSAFARVRAERPDARLALVGRTAIPIAPADGLIVTREIPQESLLAWLGAADVCVVPARDTIGNRGRWPSKLNDYLAAGRAVVMPEVGDAGAVIRSAGAGWATAADVESFAQGMSSALADAPARARAEQAARQLAETQLAWPRIADELIAFYEQVGSRA